MQPEVGVVLVAFIERYFGKNGGLTGPFSLNSLQSSIQNKAAKQYPARYKFGNHYAFNCAYKTLLWN